MPLDPVTRLTNEHRLLRETLDTQGRDIDRLSRLMSKAEVERAPQQFSDLMVTLAHHEDVVLTAGTPIEGLRGESNTFMRYYIPDGYKLIITQGQASIRSPATVGTYYGRLGWAVYDTANGTTPTYEYINATETWSFPEGGWAWENWLWDGKTPLLELSGEKWVQVALLNEATSAADSQKGFNTALLIGKLVTS